MRLFERERISTETILYALYLYFLGLSFKNKSKAIQPFEKDGGTNHASLSSGIYRINMTSM
jgi:hypothetical protein